MEEWQEFYQAVKDPSWPDCRTYEEVLSLPEKIRTELETLHGFFSSKPKRRLFNQKYFFMTGRPRFALADSKNGRIWMIDDSSDCLSEISEIFNSKKKFVVVDLECVGPLKQNTIDNYVCFDWYFVVPGGRLIDYTIAYNARKVWTFDRIFLENHITDIDPLDDELQHQIFFSMYTLKRFYHGDVINFYVDKDDILTYDINVIMNTFKTNIYLSDILANLEHLRQELFEKNFDFAVKLSMLLDLDD